MPQIPGIQAAKTGIQRYWLHTNKKLFARVHRLVIDAVHGYYTDKSAMLGIKDPAPGSISFTQRWRSALNLTPHFHSLCPDDVYNRLGKNTHFRTLDPLFQEDSALYHATVQPIAGKVAFGPHAGQYVRRLGKGFGYD